MHILRSPNILIFMSKFLWFISRNTLPVETKKKVFSICEELVPANIIPNEAIVHVSEKVSFGISNPKNNVNINANSLLVGSLIGDYETWYIPKSDYPDGSYALFREDLFFAEVVSDPAASRTIWYYFDEHLLIASTSQLAIVRYLGDFNFNHEAIPWMLSSGTLGPSLSWDKRLFRIMPDCSIILNKEEWTLEKRETEIVIKEFKCNDIFYENKLKTTLQEIFTNIKLDSKNWILPLSGGYDSRALLYYILENKKEKIKAITWGLADSLKDPKNDAYIAKKLAEKTGIKHSYLQTNLSHEDLDILINKFVKNGEGRIDSISGYLDGFKIWEDLSNENVQGAFRGDVGWPPSYEVYSAFSTRWATGLRLVEDYDNLKLFCKKLPLKQEISYLIQIQKNESYKDWRDRLYHSFRIPTVLAALSDLKLGYIEQVTPLLSREILQQIRSHPLKLREKKYLFKRIVKTLYPEIPFAENNALETVTTFVHFPKVQEYLKNEILKYETNQIFPKDFLNDILIGFDVKINKNQNSRKSFLNRIKSKFLPKFITLFFKKKFKIKDSHNKKDLDLNLIAFRILLINKVHELFKKVN